MINRIKNNSYLYFCIAPTKPKSHLGNSQWGDVGSTMTHIKKLALCLSYAPQTPPTLTTRPCTLAYLALQNPHRISVNGGKPPSIAHPKRWKKPDSSHMSSQ